MPDDTRSAEPQIERYVPMTAERRAEIRERLARLAEFFRSDQFHRWKAANPQALEFDGHAYHRRQRARARRRRS